MIKRILLILVSTLFILVSTATVAFASTIYTVKPGDNLTNISIQYHVSVTQLADANHIANKNLILVDERLVIPTAKYQQLEKESPTGKLTYSQLENLWISAGGHSGYPAQVAAAVAMAESGGNQYATGHNSDSVDRGYWQINSSWGSRLSTYGAMANAEAAVYIQRVSSWMAWTTYRTGAYPQFLWR